MSEKFWKNRKVLITGYEGFLGSHLTRKLLTQRADITGMDILTHREKTILTPDDLSKITVRRGNVTNYKSVCEIIKNNKIEIVFHLAAKAIVGECLNNPLKALDTNIRGTWNILEACRHVDTVKTIVIASSDKAYGKQNLPYSENMPLQGKHPYDASKSCGDLLAQMYAYTYGLPVAVTRCGNIYGPGDFNFSRVVPDTIRCALSNRTFLIRSDGKFTRDYIFVEDIVNGYIKLAERFQKMDLKGEAFNFSNQEPLSVIKLVKMIYELAEKEPKYKILNEAQCEIKYQYLSSNKAKRVLGWKPEYNLRDGLKKTVRAYQKWFTIRKF
jgi:CDP-glucose 4,6-dehydratase